MKIVLAKKDEKLGEAGEIVEVKDGYARNYLLPQGLAFNLNDAQAKEMIVKLKEERKRIAKEMTKIKKQMEKISQKPIAIEVKVGPTGKLFGAVTAEEVAKAVSTKECPVVAKNVEMEIIKELGEHKVSINFGHQNKYLLTINIKAKKAKKSK